MGTPPLRQQPRPAWLLAMHGLESSGPRPPGIHAGSGQVAANVALFRVCHQWIHPGGKTNGVAVDRGGNGRALPVKGKRRHVRHVDAAMMLAWVVLYPRATPPRQSRVNRNLKSLFSESSIAITRAIVAKL